MPKIAEVMTRDTKLIGPDDTIRQAAELMRQTDCGILPVRDGPGESARLIGMITDRDITIRCIAAGKGPDSKVRDAMSSEVLFCYDDQEITEVTENMGEIQVRRLPVMTRDKRLVGIVSISDLARHDPAIGGETLNEIVQPSDQHRQ